MTPVCRAAGSRMSNSTTPAGKCIWPATRGGSGTAERSGALPEPTDDPGDRLCDVNCRLLAQSALPEIPFQVIEIAMGSFASACRLKNNIQWSAGMPAMRCARKDDVYSSMRPASRATRPKLFPPSLTDRSVGAHLLAVGPVVGFAQVNRPGNPGE